MNTNLRDRLGLGEAQRVEPTLDTVHEAPAPDGLPDRWAEVRSQVHALLLELMRYEQTPLSTAQRCSGVVPPLPLFGGLLN